MSDEEEKEQATALSEDQSEVEDSDMEKIRKYLLERLGLYDSPEESDNGKLLSDLSLDGIVEYIKKNPNIKIITMAGAGISTSAGIPDFRSPNSGLYHNLEKYNLPSPQAIFEYDFFTENPEPFFSLARELLPQKSFKPTPCHYFIRMLWQKGLLLRHYTQNIDTLERVAGLPPELLVEAHGTFHTGHCLKCKASYMLPWMKEKILKGDIPKCTKCNEGVVKPDIVFFGEVLPTRFFHLVDTDFRKADLLIIMGSSLMVQPFASLIDNVRSNCPRLLINKEKVGVQDRVSRIMGLKEGFSFDTRNSQGGRDVAWLGDCDAGCQLLADKLGWGDSLRDLIKKDHERLDAEETSDSSTN